MFEKLLVYIVGVTYSIMCFTISAIHIAKTGVNCITPIFFYLKFNLFFFFLRFSLNVVKSQLQQQVNNRTVKQPLNWQMTGESKKVKIVENNQTQKDGS
jgi:hypothetical protein